MYLNSRPSLGLNYVSQLKAIFGSEFQITDLGFLRCFLGLEIQNTPYGLYVNQAKYLKDLLEKTRMTAAKSCNTPISTACDFYATSVPFSDSLLYRQIVGSFQYLTFTRPRYYMCCQQSESIYAQFH